MNFRSYLPLLLLMLPVIAFTQDTTKVEQYCIMTATNKLFSSKVTIDIDYGEKRSIWKDNRLKDEKGKLVNFNTTVDALNYLGKSGWNLVNTYPINNTNNPTSIYYVFKREVKRNEADQD